MNEKTSEVSENPYEASVAPLAKGLLHTYEPPLVKVKANLQELLDKQEVLAEQTHEENLTLAEVQFDNDLTEMMGKLDEYVNKLGNIKRDMRAIHEKSQKLKKRALRLQKFREKEEEAKKQKELELKMEEDLIPKKS